MFCKQNRRRGELLPRQWGPGFRFRLSFFLRSVTNRRLVSKAHAPPVHAYNTWNLQRLSSRKVSTDSMISRAMKSHTKEHTVQGRPTLKDVKRFRNGSLQALREINLRANILSESWIMLYQRSHQPGLSTLQLDKRHLQTRFRIFRHDREPSRIPARAQERLSNKGRKVREFVYEFNCSST